MKTTSILDRLRSHCLKPTKLGRGLVLGIVVLTLLMSGGDSAYSQIVPETKQVPIFFKLLTYDRSIWEAPNPRLKIGILHRRNHEASQDNLEAIVEALGQSSKKTINNVEFSYLVISWSDEVELDEILNQANVDILYVTSGHDEMIDNIVNHTRRQKILTLSGSRDVVEAGLSVGLDLVDGRPQIEVNLSALEAEGHRLDYRVLRLCRVVGN